MRKITFTLILAIILLLPVLASANPTPEFIQSAGDGDLAKVQEFLDQGTDVNMLDEDGDTALMEVLQRFIWKDSEAILKLLLEKGTDLNKQNKAGETALIINIKNMQFFYTPKSPELTRLLLSKGANPNKKDNQGLTALHYAAKYCVADVVELLVASKADVNATDKNGFTPIHYAAEAYCKSAADALAAAEAKVSDADQALMQSTPMDKFADMKDDDPFKPVIKKIIDAQKEKRLAYVTGNLKKSYDIIMFTKEKATDLYLKDKMRESKDYIAFVEGGVAILEDYVNILDMRSALQHSVFWPEVEKNIESVMRGLDGAMEIFGKAEPKKNFQGGFQYLVSAESNRKSAATTSQKIGYAAWYLDMVKEAAAKGKPVTEQQKQAAVKALKILLENDLDWQKSEQSEDIEAVRAALEPLQKILE